MTESKSVWWNQVPAELVITEARARALLENRADPKNDAERAFVTANIGVEIPPQPLNLIGGEKKLNLHKPGQVTTSVYGQGETI